MRIPGRRTEIPSWIEALPTEVQIIGVLLIGGLFIGGNLMSYAPFLDSTAQNLVSAGGAIAAGLTALFIYMTFGQSAVAKRHLKKGVGVPSKISPENEILLGQGGRANLAQLNRLGVVAHLAKIADRDPTFSEPVFHDLCRVLFRRAATAESDADWAALRPFIAPVAQNSIRGILKRQTHPEIQVGRAHVLHVEEQAAWIFLRVSVHALVCNKANEWRYIDMTWDMRRGDAARSMTPIDIANLGCPACGSPVELTQPDGNCAVCDTAIGHGELNWQVTDVGWRSNQTLVPEGLGPDSGGDDPSLQPLTPLDPNLAGNLRGVGMRHEAFDLAELESRIVDAVKALHAALDSHDISGFAPYATEGMTATIALRIQRLEAARLRWIRNQVEIGEVVAVRAYRDGWHEMIDVRVDLSLISAVVDGNGKEVAGSVKNPRQSSAYMSFCLPTSGETYDAGAWKIWRTVRPMEFLR